MSICKNKKYDECYSTPHCFMTNSNKRKSYCRKSLKKHFLCKGKIKALCNKPDCSYIDGPSRSYCRKTRRKRN
jgi:hypothetical protein